jgi:integrase
MGSRALSSGGERFLDTEEVGGSNPPAPTKTAAQRPYGSSCWRRWVSRGNVAIMVRWLRLEDARSLTRDPMLSAELREDLPGIYVSDDLTRYKVFYDALERDGRGRLHRRQRTRTFRRDELHDIEGEPVDALTAARDFKSRRWVEVVAHREQARDVTLRDIFEQYTRSRELRPSTAEVYRYVFDRHLAPLAGWSMRNLDVHAVERWWDDLDVGPGAREKAGRLLRSLTSFAHRRGIVGQDAGRVLTVPAPSVRALRPEEIPTREQVAALSEQVGERYRALILLLAYGGLRIGEAVALRVDRVDLDRRRLTVDASATEVSGRLVFGRPKTRAGERSFTMPRFLAKALREHVEQFAGHGDAGLVFTGPNGAPLRPGNFRRRVFDPAAERAGLAGLHLHDLRHTCASTLAAQGASATELAARLGHSNAGLTQRVYMHVLQARDERLAELQDEAYGEEPRHKQRVRTATLP